MRNLIAITVLICYSCTMLISQSNDVFTKRIPLTTKPDLVNEPLVLKGNKDETILVYVKRMKLNTSTMLLTIVLDAKLNKIFEKEYKPEQEIVKTIGQMRGKAGLSMARFQAVDFGEEYGLFYERSTALAYFTLSKKDYSIKQNKDVELDTKVPITTFSRDRSIIKAFPFKDQLYVLFAGKEDNQLMVCSIKKGGQTDYKTVRVPQITVDKGNGKSKEVEFMDYDEFEWKNDSLFTFVYQTNDESKYFHTIVLNIEQMKARVAKYTYPSVSGGKDAKIYRSAYMMNDKVFLSSVNAEKCVISIKSKSTGAEIKTLSFNIGGKIPYQNTEIVDRDYEYYVGEPNPTNVKIEPANVEKFWKNFAKGGKYEGNVGAISVEKIDSFYRMTIGYQKDRYSSISSTRYFNDINPNQSANPGSIGTSARTSTTNYNNVVSSEFYSYFNEAFEHIAAKKKSAFEDAFEKAELRNHNRKALTMSMKKYNIGESDYFIYCDSETKDLVLVRFKKN